MSNHDNYLDFLATKRISAKSCGFEPRGPINPKLFGFQSEIVRWALQRGRAALFESPGLGKTPQQLEWSHHVVEQTGGNVLIFAPLAVSRQTKREGEKFGIPVTVCRTQADVRPGINVTNYEKIHHFDRSKFQGMVIDESSILKGFSGATRKQLTEFSEPILYRLACTATPAPNDLIELTNHAEFLDIMTGREMIALFFTQDGNAAQKFKLMPHAEEAFWSWLASWSVAMRQPSDLGYPDDGFILPPLRQHDVIVSSPPMPGFLFAVEASGLNEQRQARRVSIVDRVRACAEIANSTDQQFLVWVDLNDEGTMVTKAINGAVEVSGRDSDDQKESKMLGFTDGTYRVLVSKPSICGFGLNWQHCCKQAFLGLSNSWESVYQATRRCWRFGQVNPVDIYHITSEAEGAVVANIERKERQAVHMMDSIVRHMKGLSLGRAGRDEMDYTPNVPMQVPDWMRADLLNTADTYAGEISS